MSQPRHPAAPSSLSPSKSKSSLRRPSGPQHPNPTPSTLTSVAPGLPHFEDDPTVTSQQSRFRYQLAFESGHEHAIESGHYGRSSIIPSFQPFFTLIEDSVTNEHYHPTVHYVFADDDAEIIAEAACRSLEALDPSQRARLPSQESREPAQVPDNDEEEENKDRHHPRLPPPMAGVREHYLILDVQPRTQPPPTQSQSHSHSQSQSHSHSHDDSIAQVGGGLVYEVTSAQSLSADWQVLRSTISTAPTIGGEGAAPGEDDGLMLRIQGRGNMSGDATIASTSTGEKESMEDLIERFQKRLDDIRQVMEATVSIGGTATATTAAATIGSAPR